VYQQQYAGVLADAAVAVKDVVPLEGKATARSAPLFGGGKRLRRGVRHEYTLRKRWSDRTFVIPATTHGLVHSVRLLNVARSPGSRDSPWTRGRMSGLRNRRTRARFPPRPVRLRAGVPASPHGGTTISTWQWILIVLSAVALVPALWLLDRLGLWLEDRGWLFYRRKKPSSSPLSSLVSIQQIIEPGVRHVVRVACERRVEDDDGRSWERLLTCVRATLTAAPVNPEVVRLYLAQARREGLDWQALYTQAAQGLPEDSVPPLSDVTPLD
jgi:hypothetical protein